MINKKNKKNKNINKNKKLAFLFLIYDKINYEEIWKKFFNKADKSKYNIYIHYKDNIELKYFEEYKLNNCIPTKWGDFSLVNAQLLLLKTALNDIENYKFIYVSNSCIPLKSFNYVYNQLTKDNNTHFNTMPHIFPNCNALLAAVPKKDVRKASQWCILNRGHAKYLASNKSKINTDLYKKINASDEIYFITELYLYTNNNIKTTDYSAEGATTFTNWSDMKYKYGNGGIPKNYYNISSEELKYLLQSSCLFGRKFNVNCKVDNNINLIDYINL
jgi:hypothetical protein